MFTANGSFWSQSGRCVVYLSSSGNRVVGYGEARQQIARDGSVVGANRSFAFFGKNTGNRATGLWAHLPKAASVGAGRMGVWQPPVSLGFPRPELFFAGRGPLPDGRLTVGAIPPGAKMDAAPMPPRFVAAQPDSNLTGTWIGSSGSILYVTQVGQEIIGFTERQSVTGSVAFAAVIGGRRTSRGDIAFTWVTTPKAGGSVTRQGNVLARLENSWTIQMRYRGAFPDTAFWRVEGYWAEIEVPDGRVPNQHSAAHKADDPVIWTAALTYDGRTTRPDRRQSIGVVHKPASVAELPIRGIVWGSGSPAQFWVRFINNFTVQPSIGRHLFPFFTLAGEDPSGQRARNAASFALVVLAMEHDGSPFAHRHMARERWRASLSDLLRDLAAQYSALPASHRRGPFDVTVQQRIRNLGPEVGHDIRRRDSYWQNSDDYINTEVRVFTYDQLDPTPVSVFEPGYSLSVRARDVFLNLEDEDGRWTLEGKARGIGPLRRIGQLPTPPPTQPRPTAPRVQARPIFRR